MSEEVAENPPEEQAPEKTEEQLLEEQKQREQEERALQEKRKQEEEQARAKRQEDMKKLDEAIKDPSSLSGLGKTHDNKTLAYTKLTLVQKQLECVFPTILKFKYIQHLDLNTNKLKDASILTQFPHLLTLNLSKNQLVSLQVFNTQGEQEKLTKLQFLNLSNNQINKLTPITLPSLRRLNLQENPISEIQGWKGHATIEVLELSKNQLRKLKGLIKMKALKQLYLSESAQLTDIRGLEQMPKLWKLSLNGNKQLKILSPFPYLPALRYLNMQQCGIAKIDDLKKIDQHVNDINIQANPLSEELGEEAKKKIIEAMPHIIRLNESPVTEQERIAFEKERQEKLLQEQKERRERQEQERAKNAEGQAEQ